jgi:hypothetical protein
LQKINLELFLKIYEDVIKTEKATPAPGTWTLEGGYQTGLSLSSKGPQVLKKDFSCNLLDYYRTFFIYA